MSLLEKLQKEKERQNQEEESLSGGEVLTQALRNVPSSAAQLVSDVTMPIRHPIQTAQSLASLGRGIYQLTTPGEQPDEATAKAVGKFFADRYGSFDGFKKAFATDPLGIVSDISVVFTGGAALAAKVPGVAGKTTTTISKVGNIIDPVQATGKVIGATASGVGKVAKPFLGVTTGAGGDAISTAIKSGASGADAQKLFLDNLRGNVAPDEIVPKALQAMKDLSGQRTSNYKTNKAALKLENTPVNFKNIQQKIIAFEKSKKFEGMSELSKKGQNKLVEIKKIVAEWQKNPALHNAKGMDMLKRRIDAEYPTGLAVGDSGMVVSEIRNSVKAQILDEVPKYGKVMKDYETAMKLEKQFTSELSLGKNTNAGTTLRKLQSSMRNNVNTSYGNRLEMLKKLDPDLITEIGGQALSNIAPRGLQGLSAGTIGAVAPFTNPAALLALPLQSPRLVGETAFKIGQLSKTLQPLKGSTALQTARGARVVGEIEGATEVDKQAELLRLLLENPNPADAEKAFKGTDIGEIRSDAIKLKMEFEEEDADKDNMLFAAEGGGVESQPTNFIDKILQEYRSVFPTNQLQMDPLKTEFISLQKLANETTNSKFADQALKKLQTYQQRFGTKINKQSLDSGERFILSKMKSVLDSAINKNIEKDFIDGNKETIQQMQNAGDLYKNYVGLGEKESLVDDRDKTADKILEQVTKLNYTPGEVVNLMFAHNKLGPSQAVPLFVSKLNGSLSQENLMDVNDLLKDSILTKAFSNDENQSNRPNVVKNYNDVFNGQKQVVDQLFTNDELAKVKQFKQNVLPSLSEELRQNPENSSYTMLAALAKKKLLNFPKPLASDTSVDIARQALIRFQDPLVVAPMIADINTDQNIQQDMISESVMPEVEPTNPVVNTEDLQTSMNQFEMPQINQPIFEAPSSDLTLPQIASPTILPDERDREIAMRQQAGIAGLV